MPWALQPAARIVGRCFPPRRFAVESQCTIAVGGPRMTITVEAVYENGVLMLSRLLPFPEHEKVQVTVRPAVSRVRQTAGLMGWTGSQQEADFVALSPELDPQVPA